MSQENSQDASEDIHINDLSKKSQDYLRTIWNILDSGYTEATLSEVAERMGQKSPTASEAIKRLAERGLVVHEPYRGISLTDKGYTLALAMVRRHRLVEMFLYRVLGYTWDEVHEEAEILEHSITDKLLSRLDAFLGYPERDPHGDPIPNEQGIMPDCEWITLADVATEERVTVVRIRDRDPELLRYLGDNGIVPSAEMTVHKAPYAGMTIVDVAGKQVMLTAAALMAINVIPLQRKK